MSSKKTNNTEKGIINLLKIVSRLRDPISGCPWDVKQTHESLTPYVIEEAYEVVDAIRRKNDKDLSEELGDLLLQVIIHAEIGNENKHFNFDDIVEGITNKLIRRHPHIFKSQDKNLGKSWQEIKNLEKPISNSKTPFCDHIRDKVKIQPVLNSSIYISKKSAQIGFDWNSEEGIWDKFNEELNELKDALSKKDMENALEELGDLLFTLINIGRWYNLNPEDALARTNEKFLERFSFIELLLNGKVENQKGEKLAMLWQKAKKSIADKNN